MSQAVQTQDPFVEHVHATEKELPGRGNAWLDQLRRDSLDAWQTLGWPTTRQEAWRNTDLKALRETSFAPAEASTVDDVDAEALAPYVFEELDGPRIVFVDGRLAPALSELPEIEGVTVASLAHVLDTEPERVEGTLASQAESTDHPFRALNTASFRDGAFVEVTDGTVLEEPIQIVYLSTTGAETPVVSHPRTLVIAGRNAQATLVEVYGGLGEGTYFTNAVTEMIAGENASLRHYKLELENRQAFHVATQQVHQARATNVRTHNICLGGRLTRNDVNAVLEEEGSTCLMNGLFSLTGEQHCDNHTRIDHLAPHCESHQLYKGILDGASRGVFLGRIFVDPIAQKTNADQHNPNLLLSDEALVNTTPQLEIFADDVRCTHGSTFGQLDDEAIFYMQSRGLDRELARAILTFAFAGEVTRTIKLDPVRERVDQLVLDRLPKGKLAKQALETGQGTGP